MVKNKNIYNDLIKEIKKRNGKPVNVRVIYASIESMGIREVDVEDDYGFKTTAHLAQHIFDLLNTPAFVHLKNKKQKKAEYKDNEIISLSAYSTVKKKLFVKDYSTGIFHLIPILLQIIAIIIFGFSLWTYKGFNTLQSTAVVLGIIMGLIATGGFVQAIGKQVSFYWYAQDYVMTRKSVIYLLKIGMKSLFILFLVIAVINFFMNLYPPPFLFIAFAYAFLIGMLLLVLAPLYTIKKHWVLSISIFIGTLTAVLLMLYSPMAIYAIHWLGILISTLISLGYLYFFFKKTIQSKKGVENGTPKATVSIFRNYNYFLYGMFFYLFIFTDRILAWSSTLDRNLPYIIYYEKDYEIGMDLALLVFFLFAGVLEYSVASFSRLMEYKQRTLKFTEASIFNKDMLNLYYKHLRFFAVNAFFIIVILYLAITQPWGYQAGFDEKLNDLSLNVAAIGCIGYLFLTLGILNVLFMYTLNQAEKPLTALLIAYFVNLTAGIVLSRVISYEYSAVGMLLGSFVFMVLTTKITIRFFKNLDYNYYAAF